MKSKLALITWDNGQKIGGELGGDLVSLAPFGSVPKVTLKEGMI